MKPPEHFETPRLLIRRVQLNDAEGLFERWTQDAEVTRYLSWTPHRTLADTETFLAYCLRRWEEEKEFVWVLTESDGGLLLGSIAAEAGDHGIHLGYVLARDVWGRGIMTEALKAVSNWWLSQRAVHRVWAICHPDNLASARVLEKANFEREGLLRRWEVYPNLGDEPMDSLSFSRVS